MNNLRIKSFWEEKDKDINKWFDAHPDIEIISHTYAQSSADYSTYTSCQIIYKKIEKTTEIDDVAKLLKS